MMNRPEAERITWAYGMAHERKWRAEQFASMPDRFGIPLAKEYARLWEQDSGGRGYFHANSLLRETVADLGGKALPLSADDSIIVAYAKARADEARRTLERCHDKAAAVELLERIAERVGVRPPDVSHTLSGRIARMCAEEWWRRAIRSEIGRRVESAAIRLGLVHRGAGLYASDETVSRRRGQNRRNRALLEATEAENELGQCYTLAALSDLGVSNPVLRRAELMTRVAGFDAVARDLGHVAMFYTITTPSRYHSHSGGRRNPKHDGSSPRDAQRYLVALWAKVRSKLHRRGLSVYGVRVAEPHHDGTPHWHMLLFVEATRAGELTDILRAYAMAEDGGEAGADVARFKDVAVDRSKGSAAGYVAKYIAKNIAGLGGVDDFDNLEGASAAEASERVSAWASCWGIRQFQAIGGPPVTVWRELRRLDFGGGSVVDFAAAAADAGNWRRFVEVMGGPVAKRADRPVWLWKVWTDEPGRYGEAKGDQVKGVEAEDGCRETRVHRWEIRKAGGEKAKDAWSSVNNCTGGGDGKRHNREGIGGGVSPSAGRGQRGLPQVWAHGPGGGGPRHRTAVHGSGEIA